VNLFFILQAKARETFVVFAPKWMYYIRAVRAYIMYVLIDLAALSIDHTHVPVGAFTRGVINQYESFIYPDLIVKNKEVSIERYFNWWISIKLV
jgi:hypothetical protein